MTPIQTPPLAAPFPLVKRLQNGAKRLHGLWALLAFTALWALFFWRLWTPTLADRVVFDKGDFSLHYYSFSTYQAERISAGEFPAWNPYNYGGEPFFANVQWVSWYPPRWLAIEALGADGWQSEDLQWEVAAHYWLVSLLMYGFLCAVVSNRRAAFIGSLLFTYGGYLTGYPMLQVCIIESAAWLPLLFWGVHQSVHAAHNRQSLWWGVLMSGAALGLSFLAGHPQTTLQMLYAVSAYLLICGWQKGLSLFAIGLRGVGLVAVGVGLAAVQLLPALEFVALSSRAVLSYADKAHGMALIDSLNAVFPTLFGPWSPLYVGMAGMAFAATALIRWWRGERLAAYAFWLGMTALGLLLAIGGQSITYDALYLFAPAMNTFRQQERAIMLVSFALTVLASYTLADLWAGQVEAKHALRWMARGLVIVTGGAMLLGAVLGLLKGDYISADAVLNVMAFSALMSVLFYAWVDRLSHSIVALLLLVVVDLFTLGVHSANFVADTPAARQSLPAFSAVLSVPNPADIRWQVDGAMGLQGRGTAARIPDIYGTGPFSLASMDALRTIPVDRFWEVLSVRYVTIATEPPATVALNLLGYAENYDGQPYKLFELTQPRPFAHLVYDVRVAENNPAFARQIMSDGAVNLREMAVTTQPLPFELSGERPADASVTVVSRPSPEQLILHVQTSQNALLTLPIPNYPGWQATVNQIATPIINNYAGLIAVPIPAGTNGVVVLQFASTSLRNGSLISAVTIGVVVLLSLVLGVFSLWRRTFKRET